MEDWNEHPLTLTDFLTSLLKGNAIAPFPKSWATRDGKPEFRPLSATGGANVGGLPELPELIAALMSGDATLVRSLVDDGADPNAIGEDGSSALAIAAYIDPQFVQLLLERGAEMDAISGPIKGTALGLALYWGKPESAEILIKAGANSNIADFSGETPLFSVVESGNVDLARLMLSAGADPNVQNQSGKTAIYTAITNDDVEMVKILLNAGARLDVRDNDGETPLARAIDWGRQEILELFQSRDGKK
jgi:ankyrin repeat protein